MDTCHEEHLQGHQGITNEQSLLEPNQSCSAKASEKRRNKEDIENGPNKLREPLETNH